MGLGFGYDSIGTGFGLRQVYPNFRDEIDGGLIEYSLGLAWTPVRYLRLEAGYMRWAYRARGHDKRARLYSDGASGHD